MHAQFRSGKKHSTHRHLGFTSRPSSPILYQNRLSFCGRCTLWWQIKLMSAHHDAISALKQDGISYVKRLLNYRDTFRFIFWLWRWTLSDIRKPRLCYRVNSIRRSILSQAATGFSCDKHWSYAYKTIGNSIWQRRKRTHRHWKIKRR